MAILGKKQMSEEDIKLNYITPVIQRGWKGHITMETKITDGRINIRGNIVARSKPHEATALVAALWSEVDDVVGALDDIEVVLDDYQGMPTLYQGIEGVEQALDVVEMQTGRWLVEDEEGRLLVFLADEVGELHTLVLTTREGAGVLTELDISETYLLERAQAVDDDTAEVEVAVIVLVFLIAEELYRLVHGHVQHIIDVLSSVVYLQDIVLESLALASLALQHEVCHKLHLDGYVSCSLALLASSSLGIEGEVLRRETELLSQRLVGKERADGIVCLQIGGRVASGTLSDRVLIDKLHVLDGIEVAFHRRKLARCIRNQVEAAAHGWVEDALDERTLA